MTEAEYIAASEAIKEVVWIKKIISELGVVPSVFSSMDLYCDNSRAIAQPKEPKAHQRAKTCTMTLPSHLRNHWSR
jgi:hypothetical protein